MPLTTVKSGTVTGDLYVSGNPPSAVFSKVVDRTFTLPAAAVEKPDRVKWARLYISSYCGHMQDAKYITYTTKVDWNNDGTWDSTWTETDNQRFIYMQGGDYGDGGNDNSEFAGHGTGEPYLMVNDHTNRVTSDYLSTYDVTDLIQVDQPTIKVNVDATGSYDGRIKVVELVVAYDDPSSKEETYYWINEGHDVCSYYVEDNDDAVAVGSTSFDTSGLSGISSAVLIADYMASNNGYYGFPTAENNFVASDKSGSFTNIELDQSSPDEQGPFSGCDSWDVTSLVENRNSVTFAYARHLPSTGLAQFYKIPLAFLVVKKPLQSRPAPLADFTAKPTSGDAPLTVQFTDASTGTVSSYAWDFNNDGTVDSTEQNPSYTYTTAGTYTVNLTVSNAGGSDSEVKTEHITVNEVPVATNDLSISGTVVPVPASAVFARETNQVKVNNIKNTGNATLSNISLYLYASDVSNGTVPVNTTVIASIEGGKTATVTLTDPTIRNLEGGTVIYTAVVDPENLIAETNEDNNYKNSAAKPLRYNGYKGKGIYWEGGSNITTKHTYDLKGNLLYSTQPESAYKSVEWDTRTETWNASNLSVPSGSTIEKVLLYFAYNWDQTPGGYPWLNLNFNGNVIEDGNISTGNGNLYRDWSNFGAYEYHEYGLCVYDVTDLFSSEGNILVTNPYNSDYNKVALYPSTLVVVYSNPNETRKQIFINEECDELALSFTSYGTTPEEATAYVPFTGMTIDKANVTNATLYSFAGSAGPDEGNLLFNGNIVATNAWNGSSSTASPLVFNATDYITETENEFGVQATTSGGMDALQQILVVEYMEETVAAPVANFTATPISGDTPLRVNFTDTSTGIVSSYEWDFDNDGTVDSTEQNPSHTYTTAGTYTVNLTVSNAGGSDSEVKTGYISVSEPLPSAPVANFTATPISGDAPLRVNFTDASTGIVSSYEWDFDNDGTVDSTEQNPSYTYTTAGLYTVSLTVANAGGSDSKVKTDYIYVSEVPVPYPDLVVSSINPNAGEIFANEPNSISATVENRGSAAAGPFTVGFTVNGVVMDVAVDSLSAGASTIVSIFDPSIRGYGDRVDVTVTADSKNSVIESNETNNVLSLTKNVLYNGYKGKRYTGGNDIVTKAVFEGKYGLLYSSGNTAYMSANWTEKTYTWTSTDLPIPEGAEIESARLYQPYTWNKMANDPAFTMSFNNKVVTTIARYKDQKSYGNYDYPSGLYVYNVTSLFDKAGNSITLTPEAGSNYGLYGAYLVVVYSDSTTTEKKIWINDGFDLLASKNSYAVSSEEATAYSLFGDVNATGVSKATAIAIIASGNDESRSKFFFNANEYTGFWPDYQTDTQIGFSSYNVTEAIESGMFISSRVQSYDAGAGGDSMSAMNVILVVEYIGSGDETEAPVAAFSADPTSGEAPLDVQFTDESTGSPTSWAWDFDNDGTIDSTDQNPLFTYNNAGNYTVNLTVTNAGGSDSEVKNSYITVSEVPVLYPDLVVSSINPNAGEIFANEANNISATVENRGSAAAGPFTVGFTVNGVVMDVAVDSLSAGASTIVSIFDPSIRDYGDRVDVTVTADSKNSVIESNETNNVLSLTKKVLYNGYKGKRYTGGNDIVTKAVFEGKYGLLYSSGNTAYMSANWAEKTYTWTSTDLPIPEGAVIESARLYQPYTWNKMANDPAFTMSFNNNVVTPIARYKDQKSYGNYDYPSGLYVYNVTSLFDKAGNSITLTPEVGNTYGLYGAYLVVVYSDPTETEKMIWINDEFDLLASKDSYAVSSEEATAYALFRGVNATGVSKATAIAVLASGNDDSRSKFFFNDNEYTGFWPDYQTATQIGFSSYNVTEAICGGTDEEMDSGMDVGVYISATVGRMDEARIQSYDTGAGGDSMSAMNVILVVEYIGSGDETEAPVAAFSADPTSGEAPLDVQFTDESTGSPTSWAWDFNNDGTIDSTDQNPLFTYNNAGNYTVNLTVTNAGGSDFEVKRNYINVSEPPTPKPDASFTADVTSGTAPLTVNFTDQSTGTPTSWHWDFGDGGSAIEQNAMHSYASAGTYTVTLTVANAGGSDSEIKTNYITVSAPEIPDTEKPVFDSVVLFPAKTTPGSIISISANITDNVAVTEVLAGQVQLTNIDGIWKGNITAPSSLGD
ncbi:MAG: DUF3344 domain-containing protein, partial [Euryarchaeota archaeon]|nr:DUF3344 domain-containing protein [Euryarchaeota archaeon]